VEDGEDLLAGSGFEADELFEEGDEGGGVFDGAGLVEPLGDGRVGGVANLGADGRGAGGNGPAAGNGALGRALGGGGFAFGGGFNGGRRCETHATRQGKEQRCGDEESIQSFSSPE
jgi:hypothetical protein